MSEKDVIEQEVAKLTAGHILGRSRSYARLLKYLAGCSINGRRPKELEIAAEVFGKGSDFDPNQDSLVRVYVHNLRQKLDKYYSHEDNRSGDRLMIPKGEYRLAVVSGFVMMSARYSPSRSSMTYWPNSADSRSTGRPVIISMR